MNNDNDLNLQSMTKLSGSLSRHCWSVKSTKQKQHSSGFSIDLTQSNYMPELLNFLIINSYLDSLLNQVHWNQAHAIESGQQF